MRKKVIKKKIPISIRYALHGNNLIEAYKSICSDYLPNDIDPEDAVFDIEEYGYDGGLEASLHIMRWETDKELDARIAKNEKTKEQKRIKAEKKKAREIKYLEKLEEKYRK